MHLFQPRCAMIPPSCVRLLQVSPSENGFFVAFLHSRVLFPVDWQQQVVHDHVVFLDSMLIHGQTSIRAASCFRFSSSSRSRWWIISLKENKKSSLLRRKEPMRRPIVSSLPKCRTYLLSSGLSASFSLHFPPVNRRLSVAFPLPQNTFYLSSTVRRSILISCMMDWKIRSSSSARLRAACSTEINETTVSKEQ